MRKKFLLCQLLICLLLCACGGKSGSDSQTSTGVAGTDSSTEEVEDDDLSDSAGETAPEPVEEPKPESEEAKELESSEVPVSDPDEESETEAAETSEPETEEDLEEEYVYYQLVESPELLEWLAARDLTLGWELGDTYLQEHEWGVAGRSEGIRSTADTAINNENGMLYVLFDPTYIVYYCPDGTAYIRGQAWEGVTFAGEMSVDDFYEQHPIVHNWEE